MSNTQDTNAIGVRTQDTNAIGVRTQDTNAIGVRTQDTNAIGVRTQDTNAIGVRTQDTNANGVRTQDTNESLLNSNVYHPVHYNQGGIEVFDVMDAFKLTDFFLGNAVKYLLRCKLKHNEVEDLEKCVFYIQKHLEIIKKRGV